MAQGFKLFRCFILCFWPFHFEVITHHKKEGWPRSCHSNCYPTSKPKSDKYFNLTLSSLDPWTRSKSEETQCVRYATLHLRKWRDWRLLKKSKKETMVAVNVSFYGLSFVAFYYHSNCFCTKWKSHEDDPLINELGGPVTTQIRILTALYTRRLEEMTIFSIPHICWCCCWRRGWLVMASTAALVSFINAWNRSKRPQITGKH